MKFKRNDNIEIFLTKMKFKRFNIERLYRNFFKKNEI